MKESTKYLKAVLDNWDEFNRQHRRLYTSISNVVDYIDYLEGIVEAQKAIITKLIRTDVKENIVK